MSDWRCLDCGETETHTHRTCARCGAEAYDLTRPDDAAFVRDVTALQRKRRNRRLQTLGFMASALSVAVLYAMIRDGGPHGPGVALAVMCAVSGVLYPPG